jgi:hypothetical protein
MKLYRDCNAEAPETQKVGELAPEPLPVPSSPTIETQAPPPSSACVPSHLLPTLFAVIYSKSLATTRFEFKLQLAGTKQQPKRLLSEH